MMKYILSQLTQVSAWIGITIILAAFFAPRSYIVFLGVVLFLTHDETIKNWIMKQSPWIAKKIEEWTA